MFYYACNQGCFFKEAFQSVEIKESSLSNSVLSFFFNILSPVIEQSKCNSLFRINVR